MAPKIAPRHDGRHDQRAQLPPRKPPIAQVALDRIVQLAHTGPQHVGDAEGILEVGGVPSGAPAIWHALRRIRDGRAR